MGDLNKDERTYDREAHKKLAHQPPSSSNSVLPETSEKIRTSAWITLAILGCTLLVTFYGETMLLPAIRDIIGDFHISYSTSSWILTAYLISGAVATPIAGKLSDIYGRKKMVLIIFIIYIIGISAGGLSSNITFLVIARVIQGIGISMFPIAFGIIRDQLPKDKLAIGVGVFSSMFAAGSVVGLAVGGSIINNFGWHATFFSIVPVAIILWVVINKFIRDNKAESETSTSLGEPPSTKYSRKQPKRVSSIDLKGAIALAVTIASFLLALTYIGNSNNLNSSSTQITVVSLALLSIGSLALFVIIERRAASPLIELSLMAHKVLLPANIVILIFGITMFMVYQTIPILVRSPQPLGFGGDAVSTAMVQLPFMIVILVFAPSSGFIVSKIGNLKPTVAGTIIMTIGFFSLFIFHSTGITVAINLAIVAAGISLIQVGAFNITMEYTPLKYSGVSLGMSVVLFLIGSSIGPAIAGIYMQTHQELAKGVTTGSFPSPISYNLIFLTAALISALSITLVIILRRRITQSQSQSTSKKLEIEASNTKQDARRDEVGKND
ncbi:MAG TPA: MFS transporter [Candidatus Nitrosopolaris rasttigaisensis]|nr:MFS transporter [Candidatus Nitrosopolaris rasttigaisensis]